MAFLTTYHTDKGIKKATNQDGLLIKTAQTVKGEVGLFVVCDGMGGLAQGELASAAVIRGMSDWFERELPEIIYSEELDQEIQSALKECIIELNEKILAYGNASDAKLGTTVTAMLTIDRSYFIVQIGDSRAYSIADRIIQLTKDQSLVAREVERGNITLEQAKIHPKRNVLLQCIGANQDIDVEISTGELQQEAAYLLCTDGFYHEISEREIYQALTPSNLIDKQTMKNNVIELVELVKQRNEIDNISVVLMKVTS
ncbi:PP2C family protein-serine/threonine phosphatase [Aquibacillus kalidii]|uniref:PP2C family protein-serine/threonine phosphatase n=1 Tax=Aquibacillus kalidii TaxID=2762597 RepID=UPI00164601AF|nr:protein phosphatase 2C domain-containing protein [Aquibacillus kalidii]